jgi:hypothetical protein
MPDLVDVCATALGVTRDGVLDIARVAPYRIRRIEVEKRAGGKRIAWQAAIETKGVQYPLIQSYIQCLPVHQASQAFSPGSSILKNAINHRGNRYFLRMDFSNFFPSVKFSAFKKVVLRTKDNFHEFSPATKDSLYLLEKICFARDSSLPIGYASSPYIANCTMFDFDGDIYEMLRTRFSGANASYTRYADDLTFSTNIKGVCREIYGSVRKIVENFRSIDLEINHEKTHFGSVAKGTAYITGIHMLGFGRMAATKSLRSDARFLLSLKKNGKLREGDQKRLIGLLAHLKQIDPSFYTKLAGDFYGSFPHS